MREGHEEKVVVGKSVRSHPRIVWWPTPVLLLKNNLDLKVTRKTFTQKAQFEIKVIFSRGRRGL